MTNTGNFIPKFYAISIEKGNYQYSVNTVGSISDPSLFEIEKMLKGFNYSQQNTLFKQEHIKFNASDSSKWNQLSLSYEL